MNGVQFFKNARAAAARRRTLEEDANQRLVDSGLFLEVTGPEGGIPIQASGLLVTGQRFYFRERFGLVEVELDGQVVSKERATKHMSPDEAATYILRFPQPC